MSKIIELEVSSPQIIETSVGAGVAKGISVTVVGQGGASAMSQLTDIDFTNLENKSVMLYDEESKVWVFTKELDDHIVNGGEY